MERVGRQIILAGALASLRRLFRVAYGESQEEQLRRWNDSAESSKTKKFAGSQTAVSSAVP